MVEQEQGTGITVEALAPEYQAQAQQWAAQLGLPLNDDSAAVALQIGADGLQLQQLGRRRQGRYGSTSSKVKPRTGACWRR